MDLLNILSSERRRHQHSVPKNPAFDYSLRYIYKSSTIQTHVHPNIFVRQVKFLRTNEKPKTELPPCLEFIFTNIH